MFFKVVGTIAALLITIVPGIGDLFRDFILVI